MRANKAVSRAIGSLFMSCFHVLKVVEKQGKIMNCNGCFYNKKQRCNKRQIAGNCLCYNRKDKLNVKFVKVI